MMGSSKMSEADHQPDPRFKSERQQLLSDPEQLIILTVLNDDDEETGDAIVLYHLVACLSTALATLAWRYKIYILNHWCRSTPNFIVYSTCFPGQLLKTYKITYLEMLLRGLIFEYQTFKLLILGRRGCLSK
ncbi:hypothetical protein BC939DRAFT_533793 [Gamsiella multidivaricata]|uniref:uncharacterized protein n=1 Tax=Gamsiella multidivaricata TaxID=101098 RepID=UPI00221F1EC1|nr:uncharacterized protein BC939DRAFT_533793 [Gamsiella multidivaricata]KAI7816173.1 hypothetical protein BC939DRAFT_533793 [Gamsiella multidivaricata]